MDAVVLGYWTSLRVTVDGKTQRNKKNSRFLSIKLLEKFCEHYIILRR